VASGLLVIVGIGVAPVRADFAPGGELRVMRADHFQSYAGSFLAVEVFDDQVSADGSTGPDVSFAWRTATGSYGTPVAVPRYIDVGPLAGASDDVYLYNRTLVRIEVPSDVPVMIRVTSTSGEEIEAPVRPWLANSPPPRTAGYQKDFLTGYMDPTEVRARLDALGAQFPQLVSLVNLPQRTEGYRRKATTVMGVPLGSPYAGQLGNLSAAAAQQAVILESVAYGHEGGNDIFATISNPGAPNSPLSVALSGNEVTVNLATDAAGGVTSTAAQVVDALNASPGVSLLLKASRYRGFAVAGTGIVQPTPRSRLSDWLSAPAQVQRGQFQARVMRIGKQRDGSKVGVFIYCQQRANDWVTPLACVETAEQLVRNYGTDPLNTELLDNLDVFILPTVNPDGAHYSMYDSAAQRRNLTNRCLPDTFQDPLARDFVGVDLDRNHTVGSFFDGYAGAAGITPGVPATYNQCTSPLYPGLSELSEPETQNVHWIVDTFPNIKFSLNVQGDGGYFSWSPGAYVRADRVTLPVPNVGVEAFHFGAAEYILGRVKEFRGTAVLPERVGALTDVRASEAGNSVDDQWYRKGVLAYAMAGGADRFQSTTEGTARDPVGSAPAFANEGHDEAMESAAGAIGLLERALAYARDVTPPSVEIVPNGAASADPVTATFGPGSEPAVIHYTLDGSTPTLASPTWDAERPRLPGSVFLFDETTTVKWIAVDIKGNVSAVRSADFVIDSTPPVTTAMVSPDDVDGWYVSPTVTLAADDGEGSGVDFVQYSLDGGPWTTYASPFLVTGDGTRAVEYQAVDLLGNAESVQMLALKVDATPPVTTAMVSPSAVNGWHVVPTVSLAAVDGEGIGVGTVQYRLDGGSWTTYAGAFQVAGDGAHALEYRASDRLGNAEAAQSLALQVDATAPAISVTTPSAGAVYALGASIPAAFGCTDATSGVTLCSGSAAAGAPIDTAAAGPHAFVVDAQDAAGNTRQVTVAYEVAGSSNASMRGGGHVPGPGPRPVGFEFNVFVGPRGGEGGDVRIKIGPDERFDARTVDEVIFSGSPDYGPGRNSKTPFDTVTFRGTGRWDGQPGHRFVVTASDRGEPGRGRDTFTIEVTAPGGGAVFSGGGTLTSGNVQAIAPRRP
jgi:hypothetical protein